MSIISQVLDLDWKERRQLDSILKIAGLLQDNGTKLVISKKNFDTMPNPKFIPKSVTTIHYELEQLLESHFIPEFVTCLFYTNHYSGILTYFPNTITHLHIKHADESDYGYKYPPGIIPDSVTHLFFDCSMNSFILEPKDIPDSVTHLTLRSGSNISTRWLDLLSVCVMWEDYVESEESDE